ncbi:LysR family transcriptional regulator [Niveibacterium umoris]|uniref:DNA-binding transcriptional LysR family regulator n=1 Tax=Niveibacterium umoris TaxID=1193620 RepID=A0A840BQK8_9RHOO|nr:LysR family transcriptional regulator [Niveibacterium umoris]MBB4013106.1 DNA-binding transcriptional LysR family regulator [Niveibacterium umoris]
MSFRSLRYFNAVAETGSISAAMQTLNVSQAAITEGIQRLEAHLGSLLFRRHARGMALTHAGHEFFRHTQRILGAVATAEQALAVRPDSLAGDLVIGATSPLTGYYLPGLLERYRRTFPRIHTRVLEDAGHFIEHQLINGEIDVALTTISVLENAAAFHTALLVRSPWRLWLPLSHRFAERGSVSLAELREESVIVLRNDELEKVSGDLWRDAGIRPKVTVKTRSTEATRSLVATGSGVCLLPEVLFRAWSLEGERLVAIPITEEIPPLEIGVAWRRGAALGAATEGFLAVAREYGQHQGNALGALRGADGTGVRRA